MKLLSKSDINTIKGTERQKEIQEGAKLAKKVDTLREVSAKEEENLKKFRDESLKILQVELDVKIKENERLDKEIAFKKEQKIKLEAPLDLINEWKKVAEDKKSNATLSSQLREMELQLINREMVVSAFGERENEIIQKEAKVKSYLDEAVRSYEQTEDIRNQIEQKKIASDKDIAQKYSELSDKEQNIISREYVISKDKEQIAKDKKEILDKGSSLISRESTLDGLERTLTKREQSLREKELLTDRYNKEAENNYNESESIKLQIGEDKEKSDKSIAERYQILSDKENDYEARLRDLRNEKEQIEKDKTDIELEKKRIVSQQETLKVAWNNIKKIQKK